jgi:fermentation-respiration switch protein FrsA (DUF1100 family)
MRALFRQLVVLLLVASSGCVALEKSLVFHPRRYPEGNWQPKGLHCEDAWFQAPDGVRLHGWFAEAVRPQAVVLYAHGNAGNVADHAWVVEFFRDRLNCSVLVFDYRGYGKSEGMPSEAGILADARAARRWLAQRTSVVEQDIVLVGRSLGGGVMVDLAAKDGARGLVLENTFTSLPDMGQNMIKVLPVRWLMEMRMDSLGLIGNYAGPLLQTHGDADKLIPFEQGKKLFEAAKGPKWFVLAPGRGHNDLPTPGYVEKLDWFLGQLPVARRGDL